jgi:hypothetical protein
MSIMGSGGGRHIVGSELLGCICFLHIGTALWRAAMRVWAVEEGFVYCSEGFVPRVL